VYEIVHLNTRVKEGSRTEVLEYCAASYIFDMGIIVQSVSAKES